MKNRLHGWQSRTLCCWLVGLVVAAGFAPGATSLELEKTVTHVNEVEPSFNRGGTGTGGSSPVPGPVLAPQLKKTFKGFGFDDNATENGGFRFIPPDAMAAAGDSRLIAVVNTMIESRTKDGKLKWRTSLANFFAPVSPTTFTFDPKIVYDHFEDRFVVVTLELVVGAASQDPGNISRILVAVSNDEDPKTPTAADWNYTAINAKQTIFGSFDGWADYPGFEVDEEAVYITANLFTFVPFGFFGGVRLWIIDKEDFYDEDPAVVSVHNPYATAGIPTTTMPALVFGDDDDGIGGEDSTIGTFLVSYSGVTFGGPGAPEAIQVITVDDPVGEVGGPFFSHQFVVIGDIEDVGGVFGFPALPDAPQAGSTFRIEVNDRRALDAVWRDNSLWMVTTILPNFGTEDETTAFWLELNTAGNTGTDGITVADSGVIGGEDITTDTTTFFPSVSVNRNGDAMFGFSASSADIFAGAFVAGRRLGDPAGTVRGTRTVQAGEGPYKRFFGGSDNRWGDYSGIALDPSNERLFWVFNQFADEPGSAGTGSRGPEDGRWGTAWGRVGFGGGDD